MASSFLPRIHGFLSTAPSIPGAIFNQRSGRCGGWDCLGNYQSDALGLSQSDTLMDNQCPLKPMPDVLRSASLADNNGDIHEPIRPGNANPNQGPYTPGSPKPMNALNDSDSP
jgi:hypothetical protein